MKFADVILPLALQRNYTFGVPLELQYQIKIGSRVEVQFGAKKVYSGIVKNLHNNQPEVYSVKPIRNILDENPVVTMEQIKLWEWMAAYYACTEGEVMNAALPAYMKLESETYLVLQDGLNIDELEVTDDEFMVLQALEIRKQQKEKA